jgi:hypothetical protein
VRLQIWHDSNLTNKLTSKLHQLVSLGQIMYLVDLRAIKHPRNDSSMTLLLHSVHPTQRPSSTRSATAQELT